MTDSIAVKLVTLIVVIKSLAVIGVFKFSVF